MSGHIATVPNTSRDLMPDLARAFALIGIVLVNVELFSASLNSGYSATEVKSPGDAIAKLLVASFFTFKSYSLFSIMFGAGLGYQIASADRHDAPIKPIYFRRIFGLFILGVLHTVFLFLGDVLVTYACLGALLYLFREMPAKRLFRWGGGMIAAQCVMLLSAAFMFGAAENAVDPATAEQFQASLDKAAIASGWVDETFMNGGFSEVARARVTLWPTILPSIIILQVIAAFGYFLIGLGLFKNGMISQPDHPFWKTARYALLIPGLAISLFGALVYLSSENRASASLFYGFFWMMLGSPFASLGYLGWIAKLSMGTPGPVRRFFARAGSSSLTVYLLQSVVLSWVTLEYGLGLFMEISARDAVLMALFTGLAIVVLISLWRLKFKRGPMEILLRRWTYLEERL
ncbi:MAG: hypothetical protein CMK07_15815 [Ponticaulis sp.]|nr:hypothetical protein [Ponticaulis sp.]